MIIIHKIIHEIITDVKTSSGKDKWLILLLEYCNWNVGNCEEPWVPTNWRDTTQMFSVALKNDLILCFSLASKYFPSVIEFCLFTNSNIFILKQLLLVGWNFLDCWETKLRNLLQVCVCVCVRGWIYGSIRKKRTSNDCTKDSQPDATSEFYETFFFFFHFVFKGFLARSRTFQHHLSHPRTCLKSLVSFLSIASLKLTVFAWAF